MTKNGDTPRPRATTEPGIHAAMVNAASEVGQVSAQDIAHALIEMGGGSGGGGTGFQKSLKRSNIWIALLIALFGTGGMVASYYATQSRSRSNEKAIDSHREVPMHKGANEQFSGIKVRLGKVEDKMGAVQVGQNEIKDGITELKKEQIDDLKRELARERRRNRNR
jgi:hypothetical protein